MPRRKMAIPPFPRDPVPVRTRATNLLPRPFGFGSSTFDRGPEEAVESRRLGNRFLEGRRPRGPIPHQRPATPQTPPRSRRTGPFLNVCRLWRAGRREGPFRTRSAEPLPAAFAGRGGPEGTSCWCGRRSRSRQELSPPARRTIPFGASPDIPPQAGVSLAAPHWRGQSQ